MSTTTTPSNGWHWREWAAEFAGTGLLLFAVVTAKDWIVRAGPPVSEIWIRVALVGIVAGLMVIAIAYSPLGRRSGAHLNPVVTLGLALRGTVAAADLAGYPVAQVAGGVAGVAAARIWGPTVSAATVRWAAIAPASWIGQPTAAVIEAAATAVMLAVVFGCLASADRARLAAPAAGTLLAIAIAGLAPISGAGFNPVRGLAPDVLANWYTALWVYIVGPVAGALIAAGLVGLREHRPVTGKLVHDPAVPCYMRCELPHVAASAPPAQRTSRQSAATELRKSRSTMIGYSPTELLDPRSELVRPGSMTVDASLEPQRAQHMVRMAQTLYTFWDTGDTRWLHEAVDPSFTDNTLPEGRPQGPDGPVTASAAFRAAVPDLTCELSDLLVVGDKLAVRLRFTGHFTGTSNGVQGHGQRIDFIAFDIQHVGEDRIIEDWHLEDNLTFQVQIGVVSS